MSAVLLLLLNLVAAALLGPDASLALPMVASAPDQDGTNEAQYPLCHRHTTGDTVTVKEEGDQVLLGGRMVRCAAPTDYCFSYWTYVNNGTEQSQKQLKWLAQGCFSVPDACEQTKCVASRQNPANTFFCCCRGKLCNEHVEVPPAMAAYTDAAVSALLGATKAQDGAASDDNSGHDSFNLMLVPYWFLMLAVAFVFASAVALFAVIRWRHRRRKVSLQQRDLSVTLVSGEAGSQRDPADTLASMRHGLAATGWIEEYKKCTASVDISTVVLQGIIDHGRFGTVHRAMAGDLEVVVKVFTEEAKESYTNELFIYSHPFMHHPNLLYCLGSGSLGPERWGLVLLHCSGGRLSDYLSRHTLTWQQLRRVAFTATSGLAHLHAPISSQGREKPSICHRDFNSQNLALREDMSCVVIDLGLAVCVKGSSHSRPGLATVSGSPPSLNEAGTLRYMAPELLEGAVNLSECETALRQIDVYALGLVLWECYTRCSVISREEQPYQPPYQAELGPRLGLDQMVDCVVHEKRRPQFPAPADDISGGVAQRLLRDTIEECWDADAEARLSTQCIMERLAQLPIFLRRSKGNLGGSDETGSEKDTQCIYEIIHEDEDDMFIIENYLMDLPYQYIDDQAPPAYCERYDSSLFQSVGNSYSDGNYPTRRGFSRMNRNGSSSGGGNESQCSGKPSFSDRSSSYGMSTGGEKRSLRTSEECSTRTLETLLSPSASEQPNMMLRTGCIINQSHSSLASVGRDSRNTASRSLGYHSNEDGPLCSAVLQRGSAAPVSVLHSPSSPINAGETVPIVVPTRGSHGHAGESAVSKLWSRFMRKMRRESAHLNTQRGDFYRNQPQVHRFQAEALQSKRVSGDHPTEDGEGDDASFNLLSSYISERKDGAPVETRFEAGESDVNQQSAAECQNPSQWCHTVPLRRHGLDKKQRASRPVSLEIKGSSDECSSPLGTYLSSSLNFRTPEEVVLRKSKTRVKTPRHPPLPRLSLHGPLNQKTPRHPPLPRLSQSEDPSPPAASQTLSPRTSQSDV